MLEVHSFHILSAWVKHRIADINIQGLMWYAQNSKCVQNSILPSGKQIFPNFILSKIWVYGISHYVKFEIWTSFFM